MVGWSLPRVFRRRWRLMFESCCSFSKRSTAVQLFLQPDLDERLVGHVQRIGRHLDRIQQMLGQAQGNRLGRGFEVGQRNLLRLGPVQMLGGFVRLPVGTLLGLVGERWNGFSRLVHKWLAPFGAWFAYSFYKSLINESMIRISETS